MNAIDAAVLPGAFLVDVFPLRTSSSQNGSPHDLKIFTPAVKYVPEWFPGAGFKRFARMAKKDIDDSVNLPFHHVEESFEVRGTPLLVCILLERISGGNPFYFIGCGDIVGGTAGTHQRRR